MVTERSSIGPPGKTKRVVGKCFNWPPATYLQLRVAHMPEMPFPPSPRVSDPDTHYCTCVTHVSWCMLGSLTSGVLWSRWRRKRSRHSRRMRKCNITYLVRGPWGLYLLSTPLDSSANQCRFSCAADILILEFISLEFACHVREVLSFSLG